MSRAAAGRLGLATAVVCIGILSFPIAALAHSELEEQSPEPGAILRDGATEIVAVFSQELDPTSTFTVLDGAGDEVDSVAGSLDLEDLDHLTLRADADLAPGSYTVDWVAVSADDGDATVGSWSFSIADSTGAVPVAEDTSSGGVAGWVWLALVPLAALIGFEVWRRRKTSRAHVGALTVLVLMLTLGISLPALAHGTLVSSDPAEGSVVETAPDQLRIWISEPVSPHFSTVEIQRLDGTMLPVEGLSVEEDEGKGLLVVDLPALEDGTYSAAWTVLSESDGHITRGLVVFGVGEAGIAQPSDAPPAEPIPWTEAASRWVGLLALMTLFGSLVIARFILRRQPQDGAARRALRWAGIAAAVGAAAGAVLLLGQAIELLRTLPDGSSLPEVMLLVAGTTAWGKIWIARQLILLAIATVAWRRLRSETPVVGYGVVGLATALVVAHALSSHAAGISGQMALSVTVDAVHLAAASIWVGGLAFMVLVVRHLPVVPWRAFGGFAAVSVGLLVATGLFSAGSQVESVNAAVTSPYGRTLIIKVVIFGAVASLGFLNAALTHPGLARFMGRALGKPDGWRPLQPKRFSRLVVAELALGVLVVGATGLLTSQSPPRADSSVAPGSAVSAMGDIIGDMTINLTVQPNLPGNNVFVVHAASNVRPVALPIERVLVRFRYLDEDLGQRTEEMTEVEPTRFRLGGPEFGRSGQWDVEVVVRRKGVPDAVASFTWTVPPAGGGIGETGDQALAPITSLLAIVTLLILAVGIVLWSIARERQDRFLAGLDGGPDDENAEEGEKLMAGIGQ